MKPLIATSLLSTIALFLVGCGVSNHTYFERGYILGELDEVTVGSAMMTWEYGTQTARHTKLGGYRKELIYSGIAQNVLQITYREYNVDVLGAVYARPAFSQDLKYDISSSKTIAFRDVRIEVKTADQEERAFVVLQEPRDIISAEMNASTSKGGSGFGGFHKPVKAMLYFAKGDSLSTFIVGEDEVNYFTKEDPGWEATIGR